MRDEARIYPAQYSLQSLPDTPQDAQLSVVKCAENGEGLIYRFYNPNLETVVTIPALDKARCVLLDEKTPAAERTVLKPNDLQTLYVDMT